MLALTNSVLYYARSITEGIFMNDFKKCIKTTIEGDRLTIACKLGLWSVSGHIFDPFRINDEALHYFMQYKKDGEYDKLLS